MRARSWWWLGSVVATLLGCSDDPVSTIDVVVLEVEPGLPDRPDEIRLVVSRLATDGTETVVMSSASGPRYVDDALQPWLTRAHPRSSDDAGRTLYRFRAAAIRAGRELVSAQHRLVFVPGGRLTLPLRLHTACVGRECGPMGTCLAGTCVDDFVPACSLVGDGALPDFCEDMPPLDAGTDSGPEVDAGPDSPMDATVDASDAMDVVEDAGSGCSVESFEAGFPIASWSLGGDVPWSVDATMATTGAQSAVSGRIDGLSETSMELRITTVSDSGSVSFWYAADTEEGFDELLFEIDGRERDRWSGSVLDFRQVTYPLPSGSHTLTWTYRKDLAGSDGRDRVWIDDVAICP